MIWPFRKYHLCSVISIQITMGKAAPVIQIHEPFHIFSIHPESVPAVFQIKICIMTIQKSRQCRILRLFHPSFDLKRIGAAFNQLRNIRKSTYILWTEKIMSFPVALCPIRKTARLGTSSPIAAASADHTAHKTLT